MTTAATTQSLRSRANKRAAGREYSEPAALSVCGALLNLHRDKVKISEIISCLVVQRQKLLPSLGKIDLSAIDAVPGVVDHPLRIMAIRKLRPRIDRKFAVGSGLIVQRKLDGIGCVRIHRDDPVATG